jgi:hypothetical protein
MPEEIRAGSEMEQRSLVLSPEQLAKYAKVDPALPALVVEARNLELRRRFTYAIVALISGAVVVFCILGAFTYLVMNGHAAAAAGLLGAGVVGLAGGFVRSRL